MKTVIRMLLVILLLSFFGLNYLFIQASSYNFIFKNNVTEYSIDYNDDYSEQEIITDMVKYAEEVNISIGEQVKNLGEVQLYETNPAIFQKTDASESKQSSKFMSTSSSCGDTLQTQILLTPVVINQLNQCNYQKISLQNNIYVRFASTSSVNSEEVTEYLSQYGVVSPVASTSGFSTLFGIYLIVMALLIAMLIISLEYFFEQKTSKIVNLNLINYSDKETFYELIKDLLKVMLPGLIITILIITGVFFKIEQPLLFLLIVLLEYVVLAILPLFSYLYLRTKQKYRKVHVQSQYNYNYGVLKKINLLFKLIFLSALILILFGCVQSAIFFKNVELGSNDWKMTENLYQFDLSVDSNLPLNPSKEIDDRLLKFYQQYEDQLLLIDSSNFLKDNSGMYNYEQNAIDNTANLYGISGRSIVVNETYLKENPIITTDNQDVLSVLNHDENTLNVLVPEMYEQHNELIKTQMLDDFYFQKVSTKNIYHQENGEADESITKDDLQINLIEVEDNQMYPSYNFDITVNSGYYLNNPLTVVYNDTVDSSYLTTYLKSSIFFQAKNMNPEALLNQTLQENNVNQYIPSISRVDDHSKEQIKQVKAKSLILLFGLLLCTIFVIGLLIEEVNNEIKQNQHKYQVLLWLKKGRFDISSTFILKTAIVNIGLIAIFNLMHLTNKLNIGVLLVLYLFELLYYNWCIRKVKNETN